MKATNLNATTPADGEEEEKIRAWLADVSTQNPPTFERLRKQFIIRCCLLSVAITILFLDFYRHGLQLDTTSLFSSTILGMLVAVVLFWMSVASAIRVFSNKSGGKPKELFILLLLPQACIVPSLLKIPNFTDGAAHTLRKLNISDQLVTAVADELAKPRKDPWDLEPDRMEEILSKNPFSKIGLKWARLRFMESSLRFEFGSPLADRWGFSISGVKDKPPSIPSYASDPKMVSKEILVYSGLSD